MPSSFVGPYSPLLLNGVIGKSVNKIDCLRVLICKTGTLKGLSWYVDTGSGNVRAVVYDVNDPHNKLYDSGSLACGAGGAWQSVDPNLAVTAGDELLLGLQADNSTAQFLRFDGATAASATLPAGFGGAKLSCGNTPGSFTAPAQITEANMAAQFRQFYLMAHVA